MRRFVLLFVEWETGMFGFFGISAYSRQGKPAAGCGPAWESELQRAGPLFVTRSRLVDRVAVLAAVEFLSVLPLEVF